MRLPALLLTVPLLIGCPGQRSNPSQTETDRGTEEGHRPVEDGSTGSDAPLPTDARAKTAPAQGGPSPLDVSAELARSINAFGVDLYGQVRSAPGNTAISPMSIALALGMTYGGAKGATAEQMAKVLHHQGPPESLHEAAAKLLASINDDSEPRRNELRIANRLFGEKSFAFEQPFVALTKERYGAEMERVDFLGAPEKGRATINDWVAEQTNKRIPEIVPAGAISSDTRIALVNAMYFKGIWTTRFDEGQTRDSAFYVAAEDAVQVPTMHMLAELGYGEANGVKVLQMSYIGSHLALTIILPEARDGLSALEASLTADRLGVWLSKVRTQQVSVALPRFTLSMDAPLSLNEPLTSLGMEAPFSPGQADFTAMADPPNAGDRLFIGQVFHRTFVEVSEEGTEAAAATAVVSKRGGAAAPTYSVFHADHPFLFVIHTKAPDALLFIGRVVDPLPQ